MLTGANEGGPAGPVPSDVAYLLNGRPALRWTGDLDDDHGSTDRLTTEIRNPVTGETLARVPLAERPDEAAAILASARAGFLSWSAVPMWERVEAILRFAELVEQEAPRLAEVLSRNMGRAIRECLGEAALTARVTRAFAHRAQHMPGAVMPESQPGLEGDLVFTRRDPLGVFLCILPFNAPLELYAHKVVPALLMGNAVIVKPPVPDPLTTFRLTELLVQAGVHLSAVQTVYADAEFISRYLTGADSIAAISFTGSTSVGQAVSRDAAGGSRRVFLELGGNDAVIVTADADLDRAAEEIVASRMLNSGQVCCASKRVLVPAEHAAVLASKIAARLRDVVQGDPLDPRTEVGSLVSEEAAARVLRQVNLTVDQGAQCVLGGRIRDRVFFEPTLLTGVHRDMDVAKDMEIFGPVVTVLAYESVDEAISIANQTTYGLRAAVISGDLPAGVNIASRLESGMVVVNGAGSYRHLDMPFGGMKQSGSGREGVQSTLEEFSQERSWVIKGMLTKRW